ncbi:DUF4226 domain-containing protein [Mycobacterium sp. 050272]|uniref:DUF4226 domain-containing protein n=1 Tax=Mycobacterium sp. 050272 TaxID=3142488 RepID=UPI0031997E06
MSTYDELLGTVRVVRDRTGDPNAWQAGLTPTELSAVITPTKRPEQLDTILAKIRRQHPGLFGSTAAPPAAAPQRTEGAAAEAIAGAEAALAHQNSASSQLDLQVISAIMNAHLKTVEGAEALSALQRETEAAVQTRSDLDTPAGARDFQRFLIGKLRDIRAVVLTASLDDTSKSALMAAWTSLYDASKSVPSGAGETRPASVASPARAADPVDAGDDPLLDSLLADDPGLLTGESGPGTAESSPAPAMPSATPGIPNLGLGSAPGPGSMGGWGTPGGMPLPWRQEGSESDRAAAGLDEDPDADSADHQSDEADERTDDEHGEDVSTPESPGAGPTTVTLPDGDTVTAASPRLAAAIEAAVGGASIPEAFHQQGITIPAPGTAVANPIDPVQVVPGDVGIFTDRHALALGHTKALLDGQIQHIATVSGPSFLGWEHPPAATATSPARTDAPTPTRPAASPTTG